MQLFAFKRLLLLAMMFVTTACGFHLRSLGNLPFDSIYVQSPSSTGITRDIKRQLAGSGVKVVSNPENAQALLEIMSEQNEKRILSLSGKGKVREYDLIYRLTFRVKNAPTENWGPPQIVEQHRDYSYDDSALLAKDAEEQRLLSDMRTEAMRELLRRVSSLTKQQAAANQ